MRSLFVIFISLPLFGQLSPGDSVGWTMYDYQTNSNVRQMVWHDAALGTHVVFMRAHQPEPWPDRNCTYNFKLGGSWYGDVCVTSDRSGYAALGVKPSNNAAVCCYHMVASGDIYRCWVAVDEGQGSYSFIEHPICPQNTTKEILWPAFAVDDHGNFHWLGCLSITGDSIYYSRSSDDGNTWSDLMLVNTSQQYPRLAYDVFADRYLSPGRIIIVWLQDIDVWINISTDYGVTWQGAQNITQFTPTDTIGIWNDCRPIFDDHNDPHVVFTVVDTAAPPNTRSWIMHWSPATGLTFVTKPWKLSSPAQSPPCHRPTLAIDRNNHHLYCIFCGYSDDDIAQNGYYNGDIYGKVSTDGGFSWFSNIGDSAVNITNSKSPGAPPGQCQDDEFPSAHPYVEMINGTKTLIISYLEDKDAGYFPYGQGTETNSPYRVYVVPVESIIGVEERPAKKINGLTIQGLVYGSLLKLSGVNKFTKVKILDVLGREVLQQDVSPQKSSIKLDNLKSGVYFLQINGKKPELHKFVLIR